MFIPLLFVMICVMILNQDYSKIFAAGNIKNESGSEKMQIDYSLIPTIYLCYLSHYQVVTCICLQFYPMEPLPTLET
jgi:hypothetical protein